MIHIKKLLKSNIISEEKFKKIKFDDKILHQSKLIRYFNNEIDQKKLKKIF